jgi:hypothetical protein
MPGTINGFSVAYTAVGGILLWSGIKGTTISAAVHSILSGQAPSGDTQVIGTPVLSESSASPAASTATAPATASESSWIASLLSGIGAPDTAANVASLEKWITEEGDFSAANHNNPLNTTLHTSGSSGAFNSTGVQNYATSADGVSATVQTLESGAYGDILLLLRGGKGLSTGASSGLLRWSGGAYSSVLPNPHPANHRIVFR